MAYKDEYEVARLHAETGFREKVAAQFEGTLGRDFQIHHHLAPPAFSSKNAKGELLKRPFGPWMGTAMRVLARLRFLRGTPFDPFGRTEERTTERALAAEYRASVEEVLRTLGTANHALAIEIARVPEGIRGFGHVKDAAVTKVEADLAALWTEWDKTPVKVAA